jgi:hypothetical protein
LPLAQLGRVAALVRCQLLDLIILHEQLAYLVFQDVYKFTVIFVDDRRSNVLPHFFELFLILGINGRQQRKSQVLPHFLSLKQEDDGLLIFFELLYVFISNECSHLPQRTVIVVWQKIVYVGFDILVFESLFVVA